MIYLDTSVALAYLLAEDRRPPDAIWAEEITSSRLLEYELWTRINARGLAKTHRDLVNELLARLIFLELTRDVLERVLEPFPVAVRTLNALHLASLEFLRSLGQEVELASYDVRQVEAATRMGIRIRSV